MKPRLAIFPYRTVALFLIACMFISISASKGHASPDEDVSALGSTNSSERDAATDRLHKTAAEKAIPALIRGLDSSKEEIKTRSLWILRQMKAARNDAVATAIASRGRAEKNSAVRFEIVQSLRDLRGSVAARELKSFAAGDPDEEVRWAATHHAGRFSTAVDIEFFKKQTADKSRLVRLAAYTELAKLGDKSGRDIAIQTLTTSTIEAERYEAMDLLGASGNPADIPLLKQVSVSPVGHNSGRRKAECAYRHIELLQLPARDRLPRLVKELDDPSEVVRDCVYVELYQSSDPGTNALLKEYLKQPGRRGYKEAKNALSAR